MTNYCCFEAKIAGEENAVAELIRMLKWEGEFKNAGLGSVFSFQPQSLDYPEGKYSVNSLVAVKGMGNCAWSVQTSMMAIGDDCPSLESETKRLGLAVEIFSSVPSFGFQEHVLVVNGEVIIKDTVDYEEHLLDAADDETISELCKVHGATYEELMKKVNDNGDFCIGGFGENFGNFHDLFSYLASE